MTEQHQRERPVALGGIPDRGRATAGPAAPEVELPLLDRKSRPGAAPVVGAGGRRRRRAGRRR